MSAKDRIIKALNGFYDLVGHKPEEPGTLTIMASYLIAQGATIEGVRIALDRCVKECRYPVRLQDVMQRIPGMEVPQVEAEMRAAWDVLMEFVRKYVGSNPEGNYGPEYGFFGPCRMGGKSFGSRYPQLPQRILDCVRRSGGWKQYKRMTPADMPFLQQRFFEEYKAWQATEAQRPALALPEPVAKLLNGDVELAPRFGKSKVEQALPLINSVVKMQDHARRNPVTEKQRLALWLKDHPEVGTK